LHSGISISLLNDQLGAESLQNIKLRYSFHAWLSDKSYLAFGLGAGMVMRSFNSANLVVDEPDDPHVSQADIVENRFDVDFGMEFRFKGFFIGGVINHLTQSYKPLDIHRTPRHLLVYSGWEVNVSYDFMLVPVVAFSAADHVYQWEGGLRTGFKERYWLGLAYRLHDAIVLSARTGITENLFIAYAYDMAVGKLQTYKNGSHEIGIQFHIPQPQKRFKSPRFFD
jgi:type IX secretion system PorP/SprF family membrane protein